MALDLHVPGHGPVANTTVPCGRRTACGNGRDLLIVMHPDGTVAEKIPNPRALRASLADLRRANRALAREQKDSPRRHQAQCRLARTHPRAASIRKDAIHKATTRDPGG